MNCITIIIIIIIIIMFSFHYPFFLYLCAYNNAELQTKWMKTTWKAFEETIRRGLNRSIKA